MSYDTKCEETARYFLREEAENSEANVAKLAQVIQDAIEDWLEAERSRVHFSRELLSLAQVL